MNQTREITGLVLAGGAGSRVGGQDKGLLPWRGKPLVAHVSERLAQQTSELLISCNRNIADYSCLGFHTVVDKQSGFQGPLAGIEAAKERVKTEYLAVVACDTPMLPLDLVARLMSPLLAAEQHRPLISVAHDGKREQYLCSVINTSCLESLSAFLQQGHRAVRHWYQQHHYAVVDFSDQYEAFRNHNDLDSFSRQ
jgi:molybdenum cofactor guanylyltransferase